jgi:hypothetical protein
LEHFKYPSDTNTPLPHQAQPSKVHPSLVTHNFSVIPKVTQAISYKAYGTKFWLGKGLCWIPKKEYASKIKKPVACQLADEFEQYQN